MKNFLLGLITGALVWLVSCTPAQVQKAQAVKDGALFGCGIVQLADTAQVAELTGIPESRVIQLKELCIDAQKIDKAVTEQGTAGSAGAAGAGP